MPTLLSTLTLTLAITAVHLRVGMSAPLVDRAGPMASRQLPPTSSAPGEHSSSGAGAKVTSGAGSGALLWEQHEAVRLAWWGGASNARLWCPQ